MKHVGRCLKAENQEKKPFLMLSTQRRETVELGARIGP
jgi:hypothetical protein